MGNLLAVEGLGFLINWQTDPIDPNLSREASDLALRFRAVIMPISFATFQNRFATVAIAHEKQAKTGKNSCIKDQ
ncbi:Unknown protein sequence [Pseudomonas syringae pv. cilantro]|uniref:Uncharacterized protein n=1 Tax=Pseudomonas syringae pv. cilantro TaxID=81035 RepID=A0A0N0GDE6_PSESX|nr:Unknown protein sequence [Pseudomonas syringae pv. cilantro]